MNHDEIICCDDVSGKSIDPSIYLTFNIIQYQHIYQHTYKINNCEVQKNVKIYKTRGLKL